MRNNVLLISLSLLVCAVFAGAADQPIESVDSALSQTPDTATQPVVTPVTKTVIAYYFHSNRRCATCMKLESYSEEALKTAFEDELADSSLVWRAMNYDEEGNEHFIEDYKLYTKAVVLSRVDDEREVEWKNLDKIWELVGDKDKFIEYVQTETRAFMNPGTDE